MGSGGEVRAGGRAGRRAGRGKGRKGDVYANGPRCHYLLHGCWPSSINCLHYQRVRPLGTKCIVPRESNTR